MAKKWKLTQRDIDEGLALLKAVNDDPASRKPFYNWVEQNIIINMSALQNAFDRCFANQNYSRAEKLYHAFANLDYNPRADLTRSLIRLAFVVVIGLGALGGVVYLAKSLFGLDDLRIESTQ